LNKDIYWFKNAPGLKPQTAVFTNLENRFSCQSVCKCLLSFLQMLIGTYRCTDVPGQFVWQPGLLLCAVTEGHWLLLEDLDCAPMDIVSVLVPLLETGTLSVPGHGSEVHAAPNFRIFATRR